MADSPRRALTVRDVMNTRVVTTSHDEPVAQAAAAMVRQHVGSALIMQGTFLAGILTERDVLRAAASGSDLTTAPVHAWMTKDPEAASPDTTVEEAAQLMLLHGFRHLPVLEGREVRGVVSLRDLAAARISRPATGALVSHDPDVTAQFHDPVNSACATHAESSRSWPEGTRALRRADSRAAGVKPDSALAGCRGTVSGGGVGRTRVRG